MASPGDTRATAKATAQDPHRDQSLLGIGAKLDRARGAVVMLHGRGANAEDMLGLAEVIAKPDIAYLAPQAALGSWYPQRFTAPIEQNEPWLSSALARIAAVLAQIEATGIPPERVALLGFSQGACLALDYAARNPRRYGSVLALSGGLIGPQGGLPRHSGDLKGTPIFLGCSDIDPHIPAARVRESAGIMTALNALVTLRLYPGMGHTINEDEIAEIRADLTAMMA